MNRVKSHMQIVVWKLLSEYSSPLSEEQRKRPEPEKEPQCGMPNGGASPGLPGTPHAQDLVVVIVNCIVLSYFSSKGK